MLLFVSWIGLQEANQFAVRSRNNALLPGTGRYALQERCGLVQLSGNHPPEPVPAPRIWSEYGVFVVQVH
jgi:hypothetical protein